MFILSYNKELIIMESETIQYKGYNVTFNYLNKITYKQYIEKCLNEYFLKKVTDEINEEVAKLKK
jgi:hypothetical protein